MKTYTTGRRPGVIRLFAADVVTVAVQTETAGVALVRRYAAADLHREFTAKWTGTYRDLGANRSLKRRSETKTPANADRGTCGRPR